MTLNAECIYIYMLKWGGAGGSTGIIDGKYCMVRRACVIGWLWLRRHLALLSRGLIEFMDSIFN